MENIYMFAVLEGLLFLVGEDGMTIEQIMNILEVNKEEAFNLIDDLKKSYDNNIITYLDFLFYNIIADFIWI